MSLPSLASIVTVSLRGSFCWNSKVIETTSAREISSVRNSWRRPLRNECYGDRGAWVRVYLDFTVVYSPMTRFTTACVKWMKGIHLRQGLDWAGRVVEKSLIQLRRYFEQPRSEGGHPLVLYCIDHCGLHVQRQGGRSWISLGWPSACNFFMKMRPVRGIGSDSRTGLLTDSTINGTSKAARWELDLVADTIEMKSSRNT